MTHGIPPEEQDNYNHFLDCLSEPILRALATPSEQDSDSKRKKRGRKERRKGKARKNGKKSAEEEEKDDGAGEVNSGVGEMLGKEGDSGEVRDQEERGGKEGEEEQGDDLGEFIEVCFKRFVEMRRSFVLFYVIVVLGEGGTSSRQSSIRRGSCFDAASQLSQTDGKASKRNYLPPLFSSSLQTNLTSTLLKEPLTNHPP